MRKEIAITDILGMIRHKYSQKNQIFLAFLDAIVILDTDFDDKISAMKSFHFYPILHIVTSIWELP